MSGKRELTKQRNGNREKTKRKFTIRMQKKLLVLFGLFLLIFVGLGIRLFWIGREKGEQYSKQVLSQQRYDSITLPFRRGDILDCNGTSLAVSEKVYNLVIDANVMLDKEEYLEPTLAALGSCFPQLDMASIRKYITDHPSSRYYVPLKKLTKEIPAPAPISKGSGLRRSTEGHILTAAWPVT